MTDLFWQNHWLKPKIAPGDVVRLLGHPPDMVVKRIVPGPFGMNVAECMWFVGHDIFESTYPVADLVKIR